MSAALGLYTSVSVFWLILFGVLSWLAGATDPRDARRLARIALAAPGWPVGVVWGVFCGLRALVRSAYGDRAGRS
ncbi:hypothetical protein Xcel_0550 [Xylanimonas cellulosilytica DSM 15894]|uniref:Uncharacterized protein n=1 Tax=Xylanimonas cellulosilytica (strain DSM 15894 / JCM 12276 / CECT 5975 / KCTC 9989 / LMG 20990 / NBRC 107835 / XIL07) TaxID=446471 RepID=D1BWK7_XYLCX|nr:hypothetical protein [Xylanimonas cellulosilytica]ACZ29589.1 hypothetical protein Xcel_0550 [Xylanimonas cellulosilytica DSM 15894]